MLLLLAAAITFHSDFEGGALARVERLGETHYRCGVPGQSDQDNRNRQANWYYFRIDGAAGQTITIDLANLLGEYNYRAGTHAVTEKTRPLISTEQHTWTHLPESVIQWVVASEPALRLTFKATANKIWIAHQVPYTNSHIIALAKEFAKHPALRTETIGKSIENRSLYLWTIHEPSTHAQPPPSGTPRRPAVWLMFRQHSWESGSSFVGEGLVRWLLGNSPQAQAARRDFVWKILPAADPDGLVHGGVRFNRKGYDLNRNWDRVLPELSPEIASQQRAIYSWLDSGNTVDLFLSLHNTESSEYLEGPPIPLGERWFTLLKNGTTFHPSRPNYTVMPSTTTEGKPGRMTVAQGLWHERKIPAFLMEQRVEFNAKLGRYPVTEDRVRFGAELTQSIVKLLAEPQP
jgi:murein tripeptide amidase MpaA